MTTNAPPNANDAAASARNHVDPSTWCVLMVEDNPVDAHLIRALLETAESPRIAVSETGSIRDALALLENEKFDAVLLDLFLPDARGVEAVEQVRAAATDVPIVVLSARDDEYVALSALQLGAQDYLIKARIEPAVLLRSLRFAWERQARQQAESTLQRREEHFRELIENVTDIITVVDPTGTIRYDSPSVERVLGYFPEERIGGHILDLVHPEDVPVVVAALREGKQNPGAHLRVETRLRHKDGSWRIVESRGKTLPEATAAPGAVIISQDITHRKQVELQREQSLSLLRATLEATADGILVVDLDGHVVSYNEQFARMWRVSEQGVLKLDDKQLLNSVLDQLSDPEAFLSRVHALYQDADAEGFDILELSDGRVFERYTKPQRIDGRAVGRVWSFRDVTERRALETRYVNAQKMEAVGQLAGGIAHDFNNILMAIKGTTGLLLMDMEPAEPIREDLEEIERAADRAATLTHQLLAFSRKQVLRPEVLDLNSVVSQMEESLRRVLGEQIQIRTDLQPALGRVLMDRRQIEQVILNVVLNARDSMPNGGTLSLNTRTVGPADERAGACGRGPLGCVELLVSDTGTGMDEATLARIFEPFFTTKEQGKGTGLGLSAVYGILQQSGGDIRAESAPGKGATFTISLPRIGNQDQEPGSRARRRATGTILLVDDEAPVRRVARRILEHAGHRVLEAAGPDDALSIAEKYKGTIDLLLTDVIMPGGSGPHLASSVSGMRPHIRVLYMSGYPRDAIPGLQVANPDTLLLQKPFDAAELTRCVAEMLAAS